MFNSVTIQQMNVSQIIVSKWKIVNNDCIIQVNLDGEKNL